jgi:hypothetical protein
MYFVTFTPVMLNVAMETIPKKQKNNRDKLENA